VVEESTQSPISLPFEVDTQKKIELWNVEERKHSNFIEFLKHQDELHVWQNLNRVIHIRSTSLENFYVHWFYSKILSF